jgi:hypothetical protein
VDDAVGVQVVQRRHQLAPHVAHHALGQAAVVLQDVEQLAWGGEGGRGAEAGVAACEVHAQAHPGSTHIRARSSRRCRRFCRLPTSRLSCTAPAHPLRHPPCANSVTTQKSFLVSKASSMAMMFGCCSLRRISISWRRLRRSFSFLPCLVISFTATVCRLPVRRAFHTCRQAG